VPFPLYFGPQNVGTEKAHFAEFFEISKDQTFYCVCRFRSPTPHFKEHIEPFQKPGQPSKLTNGVARCRSAKSALCGYIYIVYCTKVNVPLHRQAHSKVDPEGPPQRPGIRIRSVSEVWGIRALRWAAFFRQPAFSEKWPSTPYHKCALFGTQMGP